MSENAVNFYVDACQQFLSGLPDDGLLSQRDHGLEQFRQQGFPGIRQENWKYTDVRPILKKNYGLAEDLTGVVSSSQLDTIRFQSLNCHELVFINGIFSSGLSTIGDLPDGAIISDLATVRKNNPDFVSQHVSRYADVEKNPFTALNAAFLQYGAVIYLPRGAIIEQPVNLIYLSTRQDREFVSYPRNVIVLSENSEATVIESYVGIDEIDYFTNTVTEIRLSSNAKLHHYKLQQESIKSYHVGNMHARLDQDSSLISHSISLGGALARNDIHSELDAEGADVTLNGLYLASGRQHMDNHTRIDHIKPRTRSYENYRGVVNDRARAVFNGKVVVHKDAQKADAVQSNANLLLSDHAEVDTKPELEIYADDVKCAHGATVGQLDKEMLFYLQSRAIDATTARSLLTFAFADEVIQQLGLRPVRERLEHVVIGRLPDADLIREFT